MRHYIHLFRAGRPVEHLDWDGDADGAISQAAARLAEGDILEAKVSDEDGRVIWKAAADSR